jgi:hypothetical protein
MSIFRDWAVCCGDNTWHPAKMAWLLPLENAAPQQLGVPPLRYGEITHPYPHGDRNAVDPSLP